MNLKKWLVLVLAAALALLLSGCAQKAADIPTEKGLRIALETLTEQPTLFDVKANGIPMQVMAVKDAKGVRMAYNTCQVCAGSPYAYFEIKGDMLTCQNCGNRFTTAAIGKTTGGCNPMPVEAFDVTDQGALISEETLLEVAPAFKNWKVF